MVIPVVVSYIFICKCFSQIFHSNTKVNTNVNQFLGFGLSMIFFIWTSDMKSLKPFLNFCSKYSKSKGI